MNLNNMRKKIKNVKIDRETGSDKFFALLDELNTDLEDYIYSLMDDSRTEFVLEESLENDLDSDDEPLNLLLPEANYHVLSNVKWKSKGKSKEKEIKSAEIEFDSGKTCSICKGTL